jgi:CHAT domain-containing protein/tetratricopeptide (TPR) repeat protein
LTAEDFLARWQALQETEALESFLTKHVDLVDDDLVLAMKQEVSLTSRADPHLALTLAESILFAASLTGNSLHCAWALMARGNAYKQLALYSQAISDYDQAQRVALAADRTLEAARSQIGKIYCLTSLGFFDEASAVVEEIGAVFIEQDDTFAAAQVDLSAGITAFKTGGFERALQLWLRARELLARHGLLFEPHLASANINISIALRNLDRYEESIATARAALEIANQRGLSITAARAQQSLALTYYYLGYYNRALDLLGQARQIFEGEQLGRDCLMVNIYTADCYLALNRYREALGLATSAERGLAAYGTSYEVGRAAYSRAQAFLGLNDFEQANRALLDARTIFSAIGIDLWGARIDQLRATLLLRQGGWVEARSLAERAQQVFGHRQLVVEKAQARLLVAEALAAGHQTHRALTMARSVLAVARAHQVPELEQQSLYLSGRLVEQKGDRQQALTYFRTCIEQIERQRREMAVELRSSYLADKEGVYHAAVRLALDLDRVEVAFDYVERSKSRALIDLLAHDLDIRVEARDPADERLLEQLKAARSRCQWLYNRLNLAPEREATDPAVWPETRLQLLADLNVEERNLSNLLTELQIRNADYIENAALWQVQIEAPQPHLGPDTLLVEYYITAGEVLAFTVDANKVRVFRNLCTDRELNHLLSLLHLLMNQDALPNRSLAAGQAARQVRLLAILECLYQRLIDPLTSELANFTALIIVPHGPLHYLPFHALYDGQRYILERFEISYLPTASLLPLSQQRDRDTAAWNRSLVVGWSFNQGLPFTQIEAEMLGELLSAEPFLAEAATSKIVRTEAADCQVIHLAAHAEFRADAPRFSALHLADGPLTTIDILNLQLSASLVTLSACQSGLNVITGGDELVGFSRAFLYAGAAGLVLSLWRVEDQATARLMVRFYRGLLAGQTKAAALRLAQLSFLELDDARSHPFYWAPFFLVGGRGPLTFRADSVDGQR